MHARRTHTRTHTEWTEREHWPIALSSPACLRHDGWRWLAPRPHILQKRYATWSPAGHQGLKRQKEESFRLAGKINNSSLCTGVLWTTSDLSFYSTGKLKLLLEVQSAPVSGLVVCLSNFWVLLCISSKSNLFKWDRNCHTHILASTNTENYRNLIFT